MARLCCALAHRVDHASARRTRVQSAMNRLSAFVRTHRKLVPAVWLALLVVSVPFASQQTKHLTSGGFEVPGTGSAKVDAQINRFAGQQQETLGLVLQAKGGGKEQLVAAVDRASAAAGSIDHVELTAQAARAAKQTAASQ